MQATALNTSARDLSFQDDWPTGPAVPLIHTSDVHVWRIKLDVQFIGQHYSILSENEQERAERFRDEYDRRRFIVALILIDEDNVNRFAQDNRIPFGTFADLVGQPEVIRLIAREVDKVNRTLSTAESVKKFALLPRRLYEEDGDVTPTRKVKRRNIEARYAELIASLYGE